jgi:hypothetical protein
MSRIRHSRLRITTVALLLSVLLAPLGVQSASAAQPVGSCPDNYQLVTVKYVLKGAGLTEPDPSMDVNGDGYTCLLIVAGGKRASWHDNNL